MTSRIVACGLIWGMLLSVAAMAHGADARLATKPTKQAVGRAASLSLTKLQPRRAEKSNAAEPQSAVGRMQFNPPTRLAGNSQVRTAAKVKGLSVMLNPQPEPPGRPTLTGPRSTAGIFQLLPATESKSNGQKVLTLLPSANESKSSGQKVLTLLPPPQPPAENRRAELLQFQSADEQEPAATIMPLGVSDKSEPAATILQFED